jgi:hypothetical protein
MMTRKYVRKTNRRKTPVDIIERAVDMVLKEGKRITHVGILFNISRRSLGQYIDKKKKDILSTMLETENRAEERRNTSSLRPKYGYSRLRQVTIKLSVACIETKYIELTGLSVNLLSRSFSQMKRRLC